MSVPASSLSPQAPSLEPGSAIKFTGGRYNGFTGTIRLMGDFTAAIVIILDHRPYEVLEDLRFCTPLPHAST